MTQYDHQIVEKAMLKLWKEKKIFDKLRKKNKDGKPWSFIDGPITANNPMGVHHAWGRTYKDVYQRFKAMQGYHQRYQNGFDCQGLWVEVEVEKDLGFDSKKDIENFGLDKFSKACRQRVEKYSQVQTEQSIKLGQWMDWDNSYYTMDDENIEHIWLFLKKCHEKGWLYKGTNAMPWCYRCGTSLAQHELADSYKELTHKAVYFKVPLKGKEKEYLLIWSTTPWTFCANVAAAVNPEIQYVQVKKGDETYYMSEGTVNKLGGDYIVLDTFSGKKMVGWEYEGPFDYLPVQHGVKHKVIVWEDVGEEEGTGIVHIAPGCGAEDNELGKKYNLPELAPLDEAGVYIEGYDWLTGKKVDKVREPIIKDMEKRGFLYKVEDYKHRYPCCWRCSEELVFRLVSEWFISSTEIRPLMKAQAAKVTWQPKHGGKLMQDWLDNMGDWCISRRRFWGLPLPFYECSCGHTEIVGSVKELEDKSVDRKKVKQLPELHRPWIDDINIKCGSCGKETKRIPDVGDCWLDAGIVPFSTLHYVTDKKYWKTWYPADLIIEMREQVRLWFYSMLFMSVTLEGKTPYKQVLLYEKVFDEKGKPMHKSAGNAIWFDDAVEKMGTDIMRWMYASHNFATNLNFGYTPAKEVERYLRVIWNLGYYTQEYCTSTGKEEAENNLDKWIISRRESMKQTVTEHMEKLNPYGAMQRIKHFMLEELSRTYGQAIRTRLHSKKVQTILKNSFLDGLKVLAPFVPLITDKLYQDLYHKEASIHLESWPEHKEGLIDKALEQQMEHAQNVITDILAQREQAKIGIRWPLSQATVTTEDPDIVKTVKHFEDHITTQVNVKQLVIEKKKPVQSAFTITLETKLTPDLEQEGYAREVTRKIQALRKKSGLKKEQQITLYIASKQDISPSKKDIMSKVGAKDLKFEKHKSKHSVQEKIKGKTFDISFNVV